MDRQAEGAGAPGERLADPPHAEDAQALAGDPPPEHPGRRPAAPAAVRNDPRAFHQAPRDGQDQRHGHVGGVLGQHAGRVGDGDAAPQRRGDVDVVDAIAEIGDQLHLLAGLGDHAGADLIGDGRHEHVRLAHRFGDLALAHRLVVDVEPRIEQLAHAGFDQIGQPARHDDEGLLFCHIGAPFESMMRSVRIAPRSPNPPLVPAALRLVNVNGGRWVMTTRAVARALTRHGLSNRWRAKDKDGGRVAMAMGAG